MYKIRIEETFDSAHSLRGYPGSCKNLHGHTYRVQVVFNCFKLDDMGMALDFRKVKKSLGEVIEKLDHKYINDLPDFITVNPTAENIAAFIYKNLKVEIGELSSVTLWETPTSSVTYSEE